MCLNPKWIYKKGNYKKDNYNGMEGDFYEIGTYSKCGSCSVCINEKCNNWVIRNYYECKRHEKKCFITLTYENNPLFLVRKDLTDFIKRLRRTLDYKRKEKIRIFGAGEYGTLNNRPHFHVIIYGWKDDNAKYLDINKKKKIVLQSEIIQKAWGLGRTSYQEFNNHEIPYITLYDTPQDTFKKAYKMTREKAKQMEEYFFNCKNMDKKQRKNALKELNEIKKEMETSKKKYLLIKEFNTWSIALGWEEFIKNYIKENNYTFTEYIEDKEFATPTPWVKKLANEGDINAIEEMRKREEMIEESLTEDEEKTKNIIKVMKRRKKELKDWHDKKDEIEFL